MNGWRKVPLQSWLVALFIAVGCLISSLGVFDRDISLASVGEVWGDVLADTDGIGLQLVRVTTEEEIALGNDIFSTLHFRSALVEGGDDRQNYVSELGQTLVDGVRNKDIPYKFYVVDLSSINAFAIPGGHIFVTTAMLDLLETEAELAMLLGHEIAHIDARHCIQRFQYSLALKRKGVKGLGSMVDRIRREWRVGYNKYQEAEADAIGLRLMVEKGYNPRAAPRLFEKLAGASVERPSSQLPLHPVGEVLGSIFQEMGRYRASHPDSGTRQRRLTLQARRYQSILGDKPVYEGWLNYKERRTKTKAYFPVEEISLL